MAALDAAQRAMVETIGCMVAAAREPAVRKVASSLGAWGCAGRSSAVGQAQRIDAPWAALVNGTAAHALDYDDVLEAPATHPSAVLVPALLALAEESGAQGRDVIDACIAGIEVQQCLGEAVNMDHYARGWHTTLTIGAPSAAAACARLLRLDGPGVLAAMSMATSMAAGFKRQFGSEAKPLHAGLAAKSGIVAARLAAAGLSADTQPFEGDKGFRALLAGPGAAGFDGVLERLTGEPAILRPGIWAKRYPCCASTHRAVDAYLALAREHGFEHGDIVAVSAMVSASAYRNLPYGVPADAMQARFSMPFAIAAAACDGNLTLGTFQPESLRRKDIAALLPLVRLVEDPAQPATMPGSELPSATVVVEVRGGGRYEATVVRPKGYPGNPLDERELREKFDDCVALSPAFQGASFDLWRGFGTTGTVEQACATLRAALA
jgi:2-methylcitrate dehydratase PrpD